MTVLTHSIPSDLMAGIRTGDEQALEHGFQEIFPTLLKEADEKLHDPASSARVVEKAFLQVLNARESITDPEALDHALEQAMHQAIVREQSRLGALRRFEHNEHVTHKPHHPATEVDAAHVWAHIKAARNHATAESGRPSVEEAKHRTVAHMADAMSNKRKLSISLIVIGVLALCAVAYGLTRLDPRPSEKFILGELTSSQARQISANRGQIGNLSLGDETAVKLGAGSRMRVTKSFGEARLRAVSVDGAASFTVAPYKTALELRAPGVAIAATDGRVDVRGEQGVPTIVRVVSGSPLITVGDSTWTAAAGQSIAVADGKFRPATAAELDEAFGWLEGRFVVNGTVRQVVAGFQRWYDVDVGIGDNSIAERPAQVTGSLESLTSAMASLEKSAKVRMQWYNQRMLLYGR
jgi:ferric-dicitrate binding protein FerR (iron transport regulator)